MTNVRIVGLFSSAGLILMLSTSCASKTVFVVKSPSAAKVKVITTPAPGAKAIWVKGHWVWRARRYVWRDGYWIKPRSGYVWIQSYWG
jgi:hypothetical protein